jgi:hypothetical protein
MILYDSSLSSLKLLFHTRDTSFASASLQWNHLYLCSHDSHLPSSGFSSTKIKKEKSWCEFDVQRQADVCHQSSATLHSELAHEKVDLKSEFAEL